MAQGALILLAACAGAPRGSEGSSASAPADNAALFRRFAEAWTQPTPEPLEAMVAPDYVGHVATGERDLEGLRRRIAEFRRHYSTAHLTVEDQLSVGDKVVTRMTADVTEAGSGKQLRLMGINISRFRDGRLVEEWNTWEPLRSPPSPSER